MQIERFKITRNHLKLLKKMYVEWYDAEYGAPCIDPKRPYGNSNVEKDIAEILKWKLLKNTEGEEYLSKEQYKLAYKLHRDTKTVLQICLTLQKFKIGIYEKKNIYDDRSWKKIKKR